MPTPKKKSSLFAEGVTNEAAKFRKWAREHYKPGEEIQDIWHPTILEEARIMNTEADAEKKQRREKIKNVVSSVDDAELTGKIVLFVSFEGSVTKTKQLSKAEREIVTKTLPPEMAKKIGLNKPLLGEFKELEELEGWRAEQRERFKRFGIPFIGDGMTIVDINTIPDVEALANAVDAKQSELFERMIEVYPTKITRDAIPVPELWNPLDYPTVDNLRNKFRWKRKWMHFGVPEVLKEINMAMYEAEWKRATIVWAEVRQNGIILLRKQVAEMTERLAESLTPSADGSKRRFYETTLTNMTEFFDRFDQRNLAGDTELAEVVKQLKALVSNQDVDSFKKDEGLRGRVLEASNRIVQEVSQMVTDAESRVITFED